MQNKQVSLAAVLGAGILMLGVPAVTLMQPSAIAQDADQVTVGRLISALNNIAVQITNLQALNDLTVENVQVVDVDNVLNDANVQALNNAINRNNTEILNLRNVLSENEIIKQALNNNNVAIGEVVAVEVLSGGDIVLFYQQQPA